jgi:hypothetical protein
MSNYRKRLTITITGETEDGLGYSLDEVKRKVTEGCLSGFDRNETDDYEFSIVDDLTQPVVIITEGEDA